MPDVFRNQIKEPRDGYFVSYQPADCRLPFATIDLVFLDNKIGKAAISQAMEKEFELWLRRYPVPVMVSAFDAAECLINLGKDSSDSHIMGYRDQKTDQLVKRWGLFKNEEIPIDQTQPDHLAAVYESIPFREKESVKTAEKNKLRILRSLSISVLFFTVAVPVIIEIVSMGVSWLGNLVSGISICFGIFKVAKAFSLIKPSKRETANAEKENKMKHYFWHCERNPDAFMRLKLENFEREAIERTKKEAASIGA